MGTLQDFYLWILRTPQNSPAPCWGFGEDKSLQITACWKILPDWSSWQGASSHPPLHTPPHCSLWPPEPFQCPNLRRIAPHTSHH